MYLRELAHVFVIATTITDSNTWNAEPPDRADTRALRIFDWIASRHADHAIVSRSHWSVEAEHATYCDDTMSPARDDGESNSSFFARPTSTAALRISYS